MVVTAVKRRFGFISDIEFQMVFLKLNVGR
jgi:hypothetical protein